jgi:parallel beta-helix repeat protein
METRKMIVGMVLVLVLMGPVVLGQKPAAAGKAARESALRDLLDSVEGVAKKQERINKTREGYLRFIGAAQTTHFPVAPAKRAKPEEAADAFLQQWRGLFVSEGPETAFNRIRIKSRKAQSYVRYQQTYAGLDVFAAQIAVQVNATGGIEAVLSDIMRDTEALDSGEISLSPAIDASTAEKKAIEWLAEQHDELIFEASAATVMIYSPTVVGNSGAERLVWQSEVGNVGIPVVRENVFVDAQTGEVVFHYPLIYEAIDRRIYDYIGATWYYEDSNWPTGITDVDDAYDYIGDAYNFYYDNHGRDSWDDDGMRLIAKVRLPGSGAWYSPTYKEIGFSTGYSVDDVVAHEYAHGVTNHTSDLIYANESGAINESFSDMWGEWVDLTNGDGNDANAVRWLCGEDTPGGAIRNMANPPDFNHPDGKDSPYWEDGANVHINSGVGNKLCYLLTDGDTFNGHTISGMGIPVVADLFYECQTGLLVRASDYEDLGHVLGQAAKTLGLTETEQMNVRNATLAVGIYRQVHNTDKGKWYAHIQDAIDDANEGDVIEVYEGTYYEAIDFNGVSCTLRSAKPNDWDAVAATIIDANDANANVVTLDSGEDSNVVLKGFTIIGGLSGVFADDTAPTISSCIIRDNSTGIEFKGKDANCTIVNNIIRDNTNEGILSSKGNATIKNNLIHDNYRGMKLVNSSAVIRNNTIVSNQAYGIEKSGGAGQLTISNCIIWDCNDDLQRCSATYSCIENGDAGTGNISSDPCLMSLPEEGMIAWWKFDEGTGTTAYDSAGNNDGNIYGATWTTGQIGGALSFDGEDDYVEVSGLTNPVNMTYALWIKANSLSGGYDTLLEFGSDDPWLGITTTGEITLWGYVTSSLPITTGQWYHIAVTSDGSESIIYIDGQADANGWANTDTGTGLGIGYHSGDTPFDGIIDEVMILNRALSAGEIEELYDTGRSPVRVVHIRENSPCIDAGDPNGTYAGEMDIDFSARAFDGDNNYGDIADIGVDEIYGPISHWKFDEGSGTMTYDSAVGKNSGTVYGVQWTSGKIDGALEFDGDGNYVDLGLPSNLNNLPVEDMTISAWIYDAYDACSIWGTIAGCYKYSVGWSFRTFSDANGERSLHFDAPHSTTQAKYQTSYGTILPNTWHHVAVAWDASTKTAKLYIDGDEPSYQTATAGAGTYNSDASRNKEIGRIPHGGGAHYFKGTIDDVRIYDRTLSSLEIEHLSHRPFAYWKFNETSGTTAYDSIGNSDGTLVNGPSWTSSLIDGALEFDANDDYVDCGSSFASITGSDTKSIMAWVKPYSSSAGARLVTLYRLSDSSSAFALKFSGSPATWSALYMKSSTSYEWLDSGVSVDVNEWTYVALVQDGTDVVIYVDGEAENSASNAAVPYLSNPPNAVVGAYMWWGHYPGGVLDGVIDDVRIYERALSSETIWKLYRDEASKAFGPNPSNGAIEIHPNAVLTWWPGKYAAMHDVYFGTDYNSVNDATTASAEYLGQQDANSFDPNGRLDLDTTYYWRIDEVNDPNLWKGYVWNFTSTVNDPNLVSWWKLDEGSGTTAADSASNNNGTLNGNPVWTTGQIDGALSFDGNSDYVDIGDKSSLELSSFTISAWIKPADVNSLQQIAGKHGGSIIGSCGHGYRLEVRDGKASLLIDPSGCGNTNPLTSTTSLQTGQWYFVAGTYDGTTARIYVDGESENNGSRTLNSYYTDFYLGISYSDYFSAFQDDFNGVIDDVRFYDWALLDEEIEQLYQDGL